ncbi:lytic transglycosylase domain-containing protein [Pseudooceanicola marinus]|uniref:lytic transglycosylase domain-containing protein n=1 Tax=Pseudooceanicola marinus TaxID=396013 RepID=UPI001CD32C54|nr:lytic transglycosylase domain-containing protein [Pseudooceanicola marinus]MCA1336687.1 lytic transglycosylase domain-containing protein [Pseudooceanicola marinus]
MGLLGAPGQGVAQAQTEGASRTPPPFKDFTHRTVRPPEPGAKKRITVQITPTAPPAAVARPQAAPTGGATSGAGTTPGKGRFGWFWQAMSPAMEASGPGRLEPALTALATAPEAQAVPAPRLGPLMEIARAHTAPILLHSAGTRVSPALVLAVIAVESSGDAGAQSRAGAQGLMQLMPDTAMRYGVSDPFDADQNIAGGIAFLDDLMDRFAGDPIMVLAGYNAGETQLADHGGVPDFAETRDYVPKVLAAFAVARGLCLTPPELISDGCVFRLPD